MMWSVQFISVIFAVACTLLSPVDGQSAGMEVIKANQVARESGVVSAIAHGEKASRDDLHQGGLQGAIDEGDTDIEKEDQLLNAMEENSFGDTDMFLVQKKNTGDDEDNPGRPSTTYHTFEDNEFLTPLFTRTIEEYNVDFIIFSNPSFPKGTGHYIVLRRLESQNDLRNYELDDDLNTEDLFEYDAEMWMDTYDYAGAKQTSVEMPNPNTPKPPGQFQSGEENYADNVDQAGPKGESVDTGGGAPNKDEYADEAPLRPRLPYKYKIKVPAFLRAFKRSNQDEVIYEAFSINFKTSLLGFLSDIDPLQYSFMNNEEDRVDALMEDDAGGEVPGEGDADSESDEYEEDIKPTKMDDDKAMDLSKDNDFLIFQNNIKNDNGMQDIALEIIDKSSEEIQVKTKTAKKRKAKRTKRNVHGNNNKRTLHITPAQRVHKKPNSISRKKSGYPAPDVSSS